MSTFSYPMNYTANPAEVLGDFGVIPDGWYHGIISKMEFKQKKGDPNQGYLQLVVEVDEGEHTGNQLFDNLNLWDQGEKVQQIVQRKLNTLCVATGQHQITDLNQLAGKRLSFRVKTRPAEEVLDENTGETKKYDARSEIKNYKPLGAATQSTQEQKAAAPAQTATPPAATNAAPAQTIPAQTTPPAAQAAPPAAQTAAAAPAAASAGGSVPPWLQGK